MMGLFVRACEHFLLLLGKYDAVQSYGVSGGNSLSPQAQSFPGIGGTKKGTAKPKLDCPPVPTRYGQVQLSCRYGVGLVEARQPT